MVTLYENYITDDDGQANTDSTNWDGQTFTPSVNHTITSVKLKMWRSGTPGIVTVSIRKTSSGLPTGADLCSGTTNGDTLETTAITAAWREITLGTGASLLASTKYAICVRAAAQWANCRYNQSGAYTGGGRVYSSNSGVDWIEPTSPSYDFMFEEWGGASGLPTVTTQAVTSIVTTTATGNGVVADLGDSIVTQHGHCWNTTGTPTTSDSKTLNGDVTEIGPFTSAITGLTSGTLYYVRAYATNTGGTSYGGEVNFMAGSPKGGELAGLYAVVEERFHYVDAYGVERYIEGTVVG